MEKRNTIVNSEKVYPIIFIPKNCTTLETNTDVTENVFIEMKITASDTKGNITPLYSGLCNVKLLDSQRKVIYNVDFKNRSESSSNNSSLNANIDQMPIALSEENHSVESSTPIHEPGSSSHEPSTSNENKKKMCGKVPETTTNKHNFNRNDETESQLPEKKKDKKLSKAVEKRTHTRDQQLNTALEQLRSIEKASVSKQRNTILFLGKNPKSGETIQNISYDESIITCVKGKVDNEVIMENSSLPRKTYRCTKCKSIFNKLSDFHRHVVKIDSRKAAMFLKNVENLDSSN